MSSAASVLADATPGLRRPQRVTAVLVAHDGQRWLPRVLAALAALDRAPDRLVAVDVGSTDDTAALLAGCPLVGETVTVPASTPFPQAVAAGLAAIVSLPDDVTIDLRDGHGPAAGDPEDWVWLLHDDCAPAPPALSGLLDRAAELPGATVVGPKLRGWCRPTVLLECGLALSGAGRPERGVARGEVDQGQLDGRTDVMAVSTPGMLVRRDVWDRLGGFGIAFPREGADTDFCWRARRAGERVVVAPAAVVYHRGAATRRQRDVVARGSLRYRHRRAAVITGLVHAPLWRLPFTAARFALAGLLRFVLGVVTLAPRRAVADLAGTVVGLTSWRSVARGRRAVSRTAVIRDRELRHLRPTLGQRAAHLSEQVVAPRVADADAATRRWRRFGRAAVGVTVVLAVVCLIAGWGLWFGDGRLSGGALLAAPDGALDLFAAFRSPWHEVGLGSAAAAPPYLAVLAAAAVVPLGSATVAVQVLLLAAPVLAALSLMLALRGLVRRPVLVAAGLAYALVPALTAAVDTGRLGIAVAAVLLPPTLRFLVRCTPLPSPLPPATGRTWAATVVLLAALAAFSPALAVTLLLAGCGACLVGRRFADAGRMVLVALGVVALLWPWSATFWAAPATLLLDVGAHPATLAAAPAAPWQLGLLYPGGPAAPPFWLGAVLVVLGLLALVPRATRPVVVTAWLVVLAGIGLAVAQVWAPIPTPWAAAPVPAWPGAGTLLMALGLVVAIAAALTNLRRTAARVAVAVFLLSPVLVGGWWAAEGESLLTRREPMVISPFVSAASLGPEAPRSLQLAQRPDGTVSYEILSGAGPRLGDADMAPPLTDLADFGSAVSRMTAGSGAALTEISSWAVRFVAVQVPRDRALARQLDAVPGLRRVSTIDGRALWEVTAPQSRARSVTPDGAVALPADPQGPAVTAAGPLPAAAGAVEIAEQPDAVWRAEIGGTTLAPAAGTHQSFPVPPGTTGEVAVTPDATPRTLTLLLVSLGAVAVLGVVAVRSGGVR